MVWTWKTIFSSFSFSGDTSYLATGSHKKSSQYLFLKIAMFISHEAQIEFSQKCSIMIDSSSLHRQYCASIASSYERVGRNHCTTKEFNQYHISSSYRPQLNILIHILILGCGAIFGIHNTTLNFHSQWFAPGRMLIFIISSLLTFLDLFTIWTLISCASQVLDL